MQLTISLIPLAIESNRLFPSEEKEREKPTKHKSITGFQLSGAPDWWETSGRRRSAGGTWVQAGELAALFGIFAEVLAALRTLAQRRHAHLGLALVARAAQTRVVPLGGEVVALVDDVVFDVHARLPCRGNSRRINQPRHYLKRTLCDWDEAERGVYISDGKDYMGTYSSCRGTGTSCSSSRRASCAGLVRSCF